MFPPVFHIIQNSHNSFSLRPVIFFLLFLFLFIIFTENVQIFLIIQPNISLKLLRVKISFLILLKNLYFLLYDSQLVFSPPESCKFLFYAFFFSFKCFLLLLNLLLYSFYCYMPWTKSLTPPVFLVSLHIVHKSSHDHSLIFKLFPFYSQFGKF